MKFYTFENFSFISSTIKIIASLRIYHAIHSHVRVAQITHADKLPQKPILQFFFSRKSMSVHKICL